MDNKKINLGLYSPLKEVCEDGLTTLAEVIKLSETEEGENVLKEMEDGEEIREYLRELKSEIEKDIKPKPNYSGQ